MLKSNKCYMLDCDNEIFVWMGRNTSITERKTSISAAKEFLKSQGRSTRSHLIFLTEGSETAIFRSYFDVWPQLAKPRLYKEGQGKVAAMFKQQGYDVKELAEENCDLFIDCSGTLKVWRVNDDELFLVPVAEQTKPFSGDCYIVQYKYPGNGRDEYLFYAWLGCGAVMEDRVDAISRMNTIVDSMKGDSVLVPSRNSWKSYSMGNTPHSLRSRSVSSNGLQRSVSSASSVSSSNLKSSDNHQISSVSPIARSFFSGSYPDHDSADGSPVPTGPPAALPSSHSENVGLDQIDGVKIDVNSLIFPYERLKVVADDPVTTGIDVTKREAYLSEEEFQKIFGLTKTAFYKLPKWRQDKLKRSVHLF